MKLLKKTAAASAVGLALAGASLSANANLTTTTVLTFNNSTGNASFFTMAVDPVNNIIITTSINNFATSAGGGLHLGGIDLATGSHDNVPNGSETPAIDAPWLFFSNTGMHQLTSAATVVTHSGTSAQISLAGWNVNWNGITSIPMGSGAWAGNPDGVALITCSAASCSVSSSYTLDYSATVPLGDPSGFGGVQYALHLEGHVAPVAVIPVPAAAWLFGTGLAGLAAVARRRKKA